MSAQWYLNRKDHGQFGPYDDAQLRELAQSNRIAPEDLVWRDGMAEWKPAREVPEVGLPPTPPATPGGLFTGFQPHTSIQSSEKLAAGLCAPLVGTFGIHKFVMGYTSAGITMLLITVLTCGVGALPMSIIALVEGIIYLTKSDEEYKRIYVDGHRPWF
ncbi:MAG: GYF domain-containing protein [Pirellulales bacterium]